MKPYNPIGPNAILKFISLQVECKSDKKLNLTRNNESQQDSFRTATV